MATFLEGIESIAMACSLVVVIPAVLVVLVAPHRRVWVAAGTVVGTSIMMWARAGRLWEFDADGTSRVTIAVLIAASGGLAFRPARRPPIVGLALGATAGAVAGWLWQPCVGAQFAETLNRAESERLAGLVMMHVYVTGLLLPAALLATLDHAAPAWRPTLHHRGARAVALGGIGLYAFAVAVGWYDDLVSELFRISSA